MKRRNVSLALPVEPLMAGRAPQTSASASWLVDGRSSGAHPALGGTLGLSTVCGHGGGSAFLGTIISGACAPLAIPVVVGLAGLTGTITAEASGPVVESSLARKLRIGAISGQLRLLALDQTRHVPECSWTSRPSSGGEVTRESPVIFCTTIMAGPGTTSLH